MCLVKWKTLLARHCAWTVVTWLKWMAAHCSRSRCLAPGAAARSVTETPSRSRVCTRLASVMRCSSRFICSLVRVEYLDRGDSPVTMCNVDIRSLPNEPDSKHQNVGEGGAK